MSWDFLLLLLGIGLIVAVAWRSLKPPPMVAERSALALLGIPELLAEIGENDASESLRVGAARLDAKEVCVVVFGEFSTGKSTLINAMLGRQLLSDQVIPTTACVVRVEFARAREGVIFNRPDGQRFIASLHRIAEFDSLDENDEARSDVSRVTVMVRSPLLRDGLVLLDTPGTNDTSNQKAQTMPPLDQVDAAIWLLHAERCFRDGERALAASWLNQADGLILLPVINFMDSLRNDRDREALRRRVAYILDTNWSNNLQLAKLHKHDSKSFFEVDARSALENANKSSSDDLRDFHSLRDLLRGLCKDRNTLRDSRLHCLRVRVSGLILKNQHALDLLHDDACAQVGKRTQEIQRCLHAFQEQQEAAFSRVNSLVSTALRDAKRSLMRTLLAGHSHKMLTANVGDWGRNAASQAGASAWEAMIREAQALAVYHDLAMPIQTTEVSKNMPFVIMLPASSLRDEWWFTPSAQYLIELKAALQRAWDSSAVALNSAINKSWGDIMQELISFMQSTGQTRCIQEDILRIKAREVWIKRGALAAGITKADQDKALELLSIRVHAGEALSMEVIQREALDAALQAFDAIIAKSKST